MNENLSARAKDYYLAHFDELSPEKKFHFATRIKNFFKVHDFDEFLKNNVPDQNIEQILGDNDYSDVNFLEERKGFFEKYDHLYAIEAALFRVNHLKNEYGIDVREKLTNIYSEEKLHQLGASLLNDSNALETLSTFAINVICLTETLFPSGKDPFKKLIDFAATHEFKNQTAFVYFVTHIILCDTNFYVRPVEPSRAAAYRALLKKFEDIILADFSEISLDAKLEFLVCAKLAGLKSSIREKIQNECAKNFAGDFLKDPRKPDRLNMFDGAEHRNVLLIMSGI